MGTPRAITDSTTNAKVWEWGNEDAFGNNTPNEQPIGSTQSFNYNLRFPGQYYDLETNTHYNYFRDYDPGTGRYVQSDPIGLDGGLGTYVYVKDGPLSAIDQFGLFTYNKPPPDTVPVSADMEAKVTCIEKCIGIPLVVTGGAEKFKPNGKLYHSKNSIHYSGKAVDFGFVSNPKLESHAKDFLCCSLGCGMKYGQKEGSPNFPPQIHLQEISGNGINKPISDDGCSCKK